MVGSCNLGPSRVSGCFVERDANGLNWNGTYNLMGGSTQPASTAAFAEESKLLGRGSTKTVKSVTRDGLRLAQMTCRHKGEASSHALLTEALVMRSLNHPNVLSVVNVGCNECLGVWVEVPMAQFGSFTDFVDCLEFDGALCTLTEKHVDVSVKQVGEGLSHLHSYGLTHNDLAARNVLVFEFFERFADLMHVKLGDFGEVRVGLGAESLATLRKEMHDLRAQP